MEPMIDRESATNEFLRFAEMARINLTRYEQDDSREGFATAKENFIQAVMNGRISVDENGWPTIHTESARIAEITIVREPGMKDALAADKTQPFEFEKKSIAKVAAWCGKSYPDVSNLSEADFRRLSVVHDLFREYRD
jgi:hypothetical protein